MRIREILTEMPTPLDHVDSSTGMYNDVVNAVKTYDKHYPDSTKELGNGLKKKVVSDQVYYWYEKDGKIILAIYMVERDGNLVTKAIIRNPYHQGKPYASDLYSLIRKDNPPNVLIISDYQISRDGFKVWKRLFELGHKIGLINYKQNKQKIIPINSLEELNGYYTADEDKRVSSFVLLK